MLKVTDEQIIALADEYGESARYLSDVADEAAADGIDVDEDYLRDFLEELYRTDDECTLVLYR